MRGVKDVYRYTTLSTMNPLDTPLNSINGITLVIGGTLSRSSKAGESIKKLCPVLAYVMCSGSLDDIQDTDVTARQLIDTLREYPSYCQLLAEVYIKTVQTNAKYADIIYGYFKSDTPLDEIPRFDYKTVQITVPCEDAESVARWVKVAMYKRLGETTLVRDLLNDCVDDETARMAIGETPQDSAYDNIYAYWQDTVETNLHKTRTSSVLYAMYVGVPKRLIAVHADTVPNVVALHQAYPEVSRCEIVEVLTGDEHCDLLRLVEQCYPSVRNIDKCYLSANAVDLLTR